MQISFWQLRSEQVKESDHEGEITMENKRNLFGRRQYIIDKRSQIYLAVLLVFYLVIYSLALLAIILGPSALVFTSESTPWAQKVATSREFLSLGEKVVPAVSVIALLLAVHFILITHRLFGPLFRFRRVLRQWGEGEWPRSFKARPKDFHQEVFGDFKVVLKNSRCIALMTVLFITAILFTFIAAGLLFSSLDLKLTGNLKRSDAALLRVAVVKVGISMNAAINEVVKIWLKRKRET